LNLKSLETISTIKDKYKDMEITVIDENEVNYIELNFGKEVMEEMIRN